MKISGSLCHQYPFRLNQTFRLFYNGNSDITLGVPNTTSKWDLVVPAKRHGLDAANLRRSWCTKYSHHDQTNKLFYCPN